MTCPESLSNAFCIFSWYMFIGEIELIWKPNSHLSSYRGNYFPHICDHIVTQQQFCQTEISFINMSYLGLLGHLSNSIQCSIPFGNCSNVSNSLKAFQRCLSLNSMQKYTDFPKARLCPFFKHESVMDFSPNTLIDFILLFCQVNIHENCHCQFFPRFGQKTEFS